MSGYLLLLTVPCQRSCFLLNGRLDINNNKVENSSRMIVEGPYQFLLLCTNRFCNINGTIVEKLKFKKLKFSIHFQYIQSLRSNVAILIHVWTLVGVSTI